MAGAQKMFDTVTGDSIQASDAPLPDLTRLSHAEKDALIRALWQRLDAAEQRLAELEHFHPEWK